MGVHPKGSPTTGALPSPVTRVVLFAPVVEGPSVQPEHPPNKNAQTIDREWLFGIMWRVMQSQLHKQLEVYAEGTRRNAQLLR